MWIAVVSIGLFVVSCSAISIVLSKNSYWSCSTGRALSKLKDVDVNRILLAAGGLWGLRWYLASEYHIFYAGSASGTSLPYLLVIAQQAADFLAVGVSMWAVVRLGHRDRSRWEFVAWILLVAQGAYVFVQGRREMLFFAILCGLVFLYTRRQTSWRYVAVAVVSGVILVMFAFPIYQATRVTIGERLGWSQERITVGTYGRSIVAGLAREDIGEIYMRNLENRLSTYYEWQVQLAKLRSSFGGLNGRLALAGVYYAIPRVLLDNKHQRAWGEHLIEESYGWKGNDRPNSVLTAGYIDFGIVGASVYGIVFVVIVAVLGQMAFVAARYSPLLANGLLGVVILMALRTEITMVSVFATVRNIMLVAIGAVVLGVLARAVRESIKGTRRTARPRDSGRRKLPSG